MDISISAVVTLLLPVPAFVAYRHPAAYRKVFGWLFMLASIVILALMLWDVGAASMYRAMRPFID
jgi:hypothetical protein